MYVGVVVAYNPQREEICKNIDTYINELDVLYVVDNSSKNNGDIFNGYNKVKYIPNYDNLGISAALNIGAKEAINNKYKWILTMDQDSHFEKDAISKMKEYINNSDKTNEKLGIVSPFHSTKRTEGIKLEGVDYPILVMTSESTKFRGLFRCWRSFLNGILLTVLILILFSIEKKRIRDLRKSMMLFYNMS